MLMLVYVKMLG